MAVIQDLPPELLYRILELVGGTQVDLYQEAGTRRSFARTSLVARSWRTPSQYLLASTLQTYTGSQVWKRYLARPSERFTSPVSTMRLLSLAHSKTSADDLALLQQRGITVQELEINTDVLLLTSAHLPLFQGVRRLTLWGSVKLDDDLGDDTRFALEALHIGSPGRELPAFMLPLSAVAPRLTRLTLNTWLSSLSNSFNAPLQDLAPQLRHLRLERELFLPLQGGFDLDRFLSACISLTSLRFDPVGPSSLNHILASVTSPLTLLNIDLRLRSVDERELMTAHLAGVFDHPCMAKLKRWRMSGSVYYGNGRGRDISASAMEEWRAACRARGIEPRGAERYFTD